MYQYDYKEYKDKWWYEIRNLEDFRNVSFPVESELTEEILNRFNITRHEYIPPAPPEPTLDEAKARKKQELTDARDAVEFQNVTTDKGTFAFDELSQSRLNRAKEAMTDLQTRNWTTVDKQVVVMYKPDFQAISDASIVRSDIAFAKLNALEEQVDNATTVEEVQAIHW